MAASPLPVTQPIDFQGDRLDARRSEGKLLLDGNVEVIHGKTKLYADKMVIQQDQTAGTITEIEAEGNVRLIEPERRGRAQHARYFPNEGKLILTGRPVIWDRGDELSGRRMVLHSEPDRIEVEGARAVVQPERASEAAGESSSEGTARGEAGTP